MRASADERVRPLPGDTLIPQPLDTLTHGVTIQRAPGEVWPWLVQMGAGSRAGWISPDGTPDVTWTFVLEEPTPGMTRLLVRARGGARYRFRGLPLPLTRLVVPLVHFVMQRKQLLGIAHRAERRGPAS